jgi:salicylate hydroxylase
MSADRIRIAVVGAGIAGLTLAAALARAGLHCDVFEQTRLIGDVGAGVQVAPNAAVLLHRLGLGERLREVAVQPHAIDLRRWEDNSILRRTPLGRECERLFGAPYHTVLRSDLYRTLLERLPGGVVHLGLHCTEVREHHDGVELRFSDGSACTADIVVGADGIHSRVRELLVRDTPKFCGQSIYRALVPAERLPFLLVEPKVVIWLGPRRHCVCYPVAGGRLISIAASVPDPHWGAESWSAQGRSADLVAAYAGWHQEVIDVVSAPEVIGRWALHDRDTLQRWSTERITLVGDAAHPMLPFLAQGANQAIEDAAALATCLRGARREDISSALARYELARRPRTEDVHSMSRANNTALHLPDGEQQRRRDEALAVRRELADQQWIYGYDAEAAVAA